MRIRVLSAGLLLIAALAAGATADNFKDPLEIPAAATSLATSQRLVAVAQAGKRLVAVGAGGVVITSDDSGKNWLQAKTPVSSDLNAVQFATPQKGWVVGHDGVVLHTEDGGSTWTKQFDGRMAKNLLVEHFKKLSSEGNPEGDRLLPDVELNYANGPEQALLDLWFWNENEGFIVGSFGTLFATHDGGKTWESWMERVEVDDLFHYNAVRGIGDDIFVASEQGTVFKLDREKQRFVPKSTGYHGSLFSLGGEGRFIIAFGLRGTAYRSADAGETWESLPLAPGGTVSDTIFKNGRIVAVTRMGQLIVSSDQGTSFRTVPVERPMLFTGVAAVGDTVAIVGMNGVQEIRLQ